MEAAAESAKVLQQDFEKLQGIAKQFFEELKTDLDGLSKQTQNSIGELDRQKQEWKASFNNIDMKKVETVKRFKINVGGKVFYINANDLTQKNKNGTSNLFAMLLTGKWKIDLGNC